VQGDVRSASADETEIRHELAARYKDVEAAASTKAGTHERRMHTLYRWEHRLSPLAGAMTAITTGAAATGLSLLLGKNSVAFAVIGIVAGILLAVIGRLGLRGRAQNAERRAEQYRHIEGDAGDDLAVLSSTPVDAARKELKKLRTRLSEAGTNLAD
jgi:hypothetical protein